MKESYKTIRPEQIRNVYQENPLTTDSSEQSRTDLFRSSSGWMVFWGKNTQDKIDTKIVQWLFYLLAARWMYLFGRMLILLIVHQRRVDKCCVNINVLERQIFTVYLTTSKAPMASLGTLQRMKTITMTQQILASRCSMARLWGGFGQIDKLCNSNQIYLYNEGFPPCCCSSEAWRREFWRIFCSLETRGGIWEWGLWWPAGGTPGHGNMIM